MPVVTETVWVEVVMVFQFRTEQALRRDLFVWRSIVIREGMRRVKLVSGAAIGKSVAGGHVAELPARGQRNGG